MRNANTIVRGFTACVIGLCLSGWSLGTSAAAATIVVTTNQDVVDPPFNASGLCGSGGTVADLPRAGSTVSLREAVIAANNTPGEKTIKFVPSLNGATIVTTGPLFLCGGHTTLNGDVNGDETPDVTVDGRAVSIHDVIGVASSHNLVTNLQVLVPLPSFHIAAGISVTNGLGTSVMDNTIAHNIVHGPIAVTAGINSTNELSLHDVSIKHTSVRNNTTGGIAAVIYGKHDVITNLTIAHNTVSGVTNIGGPVRIGPAILVVGGLQNSFDPHDPGASENRLDVTINDNLVTGNSNPGDTAGIAILGGIVSSSHNHVAAQILNNTITDNTGRGISATAGILGGAGNHINVTVRDNTVTGNRLPGDTVGISVLDGFASSGNHMTAALRENTITDNTGTGISVGSGLDNSSDNDVDVAIRDNTLENNAGLGILTFGAIGALVSPAGDSSGNTLDARIERNTVKNAFLFGIRVVGGAGSRDGTPNKVANANEVDAVVRDNTVSGTSGEGIKLEAGGSGVANDNEVEVTVRKNTVCGSAAADIHAVGGFLGIPSLLLPNQGTGNTLEGEIGKNTATTVVVENGVAGNSAHVTQSKNVPCL